MSHSNNVFLTQTVDATVNSLTALNLNPNENVITDENNKLISGPLPIVPTVPTTTLASGFYVPAITLSTGTALSVGNCTWSRIYSNPIVTGEGVIRINVEFEFTATATTKELVIIPVPTNHMALGDFTLIASGSTSTKTIPLFAHQPHTSSITNIEFDLIRTDGTVMTLGDVYTVYVEWSYRI